MGARGKAGKEADLPGFNFVIVFVLIEKPDRSYASYRLIMR